MSECKNAKYYGYKVGDRFKYKSQAEDVTDVFNMGDVLILDEDDDTTCPRFENQNGVKAYEELYLLEKLEEPKSVNYADFVGSQLTVKLDGYGFCRDYIGTVFTIEAYSDTGYSGGHGFKVKGYDNWGLEFVGVESFFPNGLVEEVTPQHEEVQPEGVQEVTENSQNCPSAAIQEMLLSCFDDKISVDISMDSVKVVWRGLTFLVDEEVSLEQILKAVDLLSQQQVEG